MTTQSEPEITSLDMAGLESINWTAIKTERISSTTLNSSNGPKEQRAVTTKGQVDMMSPKFLEDCKLLHEKTGVSMLVCKKALYRSDNDMQKAEAYLLSRDWAKTMLITYGHPR